MIPTRHHSSWLQSLEVSHSFDIAVIVISSRFHSLLDLSHSSKDSVGIFADLWRQELVMLGLAGIQHRGMAVFLLLTTDLHRLLFGYHSVYLIIIESAALIAHNT